MSTSMITGSPLKSMLRFALPLLIGNLLQQTYNIIDAAIVGQTLGRMRWPVWVPAAVCSFWYWDSALESVPDLEYQLQNILTPEITGK